MPDAEGYRIDFDSRLIEDCVLLDIETRPWQTRVRFRMARNPVYEVPDLEARDRGFVSFHAQWFQDLELGKPVCELLAGNPSLRARTAKCFVLAARSGKEESADLHGASQTGLPNLSIRVQPTTLLRPVELLPMLRHELGHVEDMLDPSFGYQKDLPLLDAGPSYDNLVRSRYHVVWDASIDGRLCRAGFLPMESAKIRRREFAATFAGMGGSMDDVFHRFFNGDRPTHQEILAFVVNPSEQPAASEMVVQGRCALCRFPNATLFPSGAIMSGAATGCIQADFPEWTPDWQICRQCADIYEVAAQPETGESQFLNAMKW